MSKPRYKNEYGGEFVGQSGGLDVWIVRHQPPCRWQSVLNTREGIKIHLRPSDSSGRCYNYTLVMAKNYLKSDYGTEMTKALRIAIAYLEDPSVSPNSNL